MTTQVTIDRDNNVLPTPPLLLSLFCLLAFLVPFETLISILMHGLLSRTVGDAYLLITLGPALLGISLVLVLRARLPKAPHVYVVLGLFLLLGIWPLVPSALQTRHDISFEAAAWQLLFGFLVPVFFALAVLSLERNQRHRLWFWFYAGWVAFFLLGLVVLYVSYNEALSDPGFAQLPLGQRIVAWRYTWNLDVAGQEEMNRFSLYVGNANKTSNYILVFLLLSTRFLGRSNIDKDKRAGWLYSVFWILGVFYLVVLLSRLAMLLLPFVIWQSGIVRMMSARSKLLIAIGLAVLLIIGSSTIVTVADYILTDRTSVDSAINPLGTGLQRFEQWNALFKEIERHPESIYLGRGTGAYGIEVFGDYRSGTHNMFLDVLEEGGLPGLLILLLTMIAVFQNAFSVHGFKVRDGLAFSALLMMVALMVREHSVSYLFVSSLGGLCLTLIFILPLVPAESAAFPS